MKKALLLVMAMCAFHAPAHAQSTPNWRQNYVPSVKEWEDWWSRKMDARNGSLTSPYIAGGIMTGTDAGGALVTPSGIANTVVRSLRAKLGDFLTTADFGAKCDGTSDDTTPIQNGLTALAGTGVALQVRGICVAGALTVPSGTRLVGSNQGAVLKVSAASPAYMLVLADNASDVTIEGITFDGTYMPVGVQGALINSPASASITNIHIENNHFTNIPTTGGQVSHATVMNGVDGLFISGNVVDQSSGDAINVNGGYAMVTHNRVSNAGDGCIAFNNGARGSISDNVLTKCNLGIGAGPEGETTDTDIAQNISITANTFDTCQYGVNMGDYGYAGRSGPVNWQITGNTFRDTENVGIEYDINPAAPINGTITGNTFYGTGSTNYDGTAYANAHDIRINGGSNINIVGNSFMSPKGTANTQTAVKVYNSTSYNISNNTIYDPAGGHYIYTLYSSYSTNGTINGNTITNAGTGILFDGAQGMYYSTASNNVMIGMATNGIEVVTEAYFSVMMGNVMSVNSAGTGILLPSKGLMFSVVGNVITMGSGTAITPAPSSGWTDVTIYANTPGGSTVPAAIINGVTQ